jgi:hypothetical protein
VLILTTRLRHQGRCPIFSHAPPSCLEYVVEVQTKLILFESVGRANRRERSDRVHLSADKID